MSCADRPFAAQHLTLTPYTSCSIHRSQGVQPRPCEAPVCPAVPHRPHPYTLHGAELFTGNTLKMTAAVLEGKASLGALAHNWAWSYAGNFVGSLAMVAAVLATGG